MDMPRVFADFQNADAEGRIRLNCVGTIDDLARLGIRLNEGLELELYGEDLEAHGRVEYSASEGVWVAVIDWEGFALDRSTRTKSRSFVNN